MNVTDEISIDEYNLVLQKTCKHENQEVINYDYVWRDGDVVCKECGEYIRPFDGG